MNKILAIVFVFLLFLITAQLGYWFWLKSQKPNPKILVSKPPSLTPVASPESSFSSSSFKILYQDPNDKEGKTVIYESKTHKFSGAGEFYDYSTSPARLIHMIGVFEQWEKINESKDRYLILSNPITKKPLQKARVAFEKSELFDGGMNATALAVEDIAKNKVDNLKKQTISISEEKIDELIKKGDVVIIIPHLIFTKDGRVKGLRYDEKGSILAGWLVFRQKLTKE